jgi:hypothetical protein
MLEPLRVHGWKASIEREGEDDEYFVIAAERGGHRHLVGLLYGSAIDNRIYKKLASQVEHIYANGELYKIEQYAFGIDTPVSAAKDFPALMLEWNKASAEGKFAGGVDDAECENEDELSASHRLLLSETPIDAIWLRLRQFHSVTLATKLIKERAKRGSVSISADVIRAKAEGVAYALRNATDYFNSEQTRNVSQRILNLYYGGMAFAFAEMLASPSGPTTLADIEESTKQGHGLYTIDGKTDGLQDIVVGVIASGFFSAWMRFLGLNMDNVPSKKPKKLDDVAILLPGSWVTLEQLFARIPEISDLFSDIFESPALWLNPSYDQAANPNTFTMDTNVRPSRVYAVLADATGRLTKEDVATFPGPFGEIQPIVSSGKERRFRVAVDLSGKKIWWDALPLHQSPLGKTALILPVFGNVGSYRSICLVLLYALSIVVRYRPSVWRRVQEGDLDHMRVLIEAFLAVVERVLPEQFLEQISGQKVAEKQPGSFF